MGKKKQVQGSPVFFNGCYVGAFFWRIDLKLCMGGVAFSRNVWHPLKLTWHLKMDGWETTFILGRPIFRGYVSFRDREIVKQSFFCVANLSRSPSNLYWDDPSGAEYYLMFQESVNKNACSKNYYCKLFLFNKSNIQIIIILDQTRTSWISGARHQLFEPSRVSGHVLQAIPTSSISLAKTPNPWIWIQSHGPKNGGFFGRVGSLFGMMGHKSGGNLR